MRKTSAIFLAALMCGMAPAVSGDTLQMGTSENAALFEQPGQTYAARRRPADHTVGICAVRGFLRARPGHPRRHQTLIRAPVTLTHPAAHDAAGAVRLCDNRGLFENVDPP